MKEEKKIEEKKRIFGFRSQKKWKMVIAILYYFVGILMAFAVITDWTIDISLKDTILVKVSDLFKLLLYFLPFIVLSDFSRDIRSKIPLLKDNKKSKTIIFFIILIFVIPIISNSITNTLHSEEYKEKVRIEQEQLEKAEEEDNKIKLEEKNNKAEENKKEEAKKLQEEKEKKEAEENAKKEEEEEAKKEAEKTKVNEEKSFKESCKSYKYKDIARNPDKYKGKNIKFTGKVMQVSEGWFNSVTILLQVTKNEYGWYEDNVYCNYTYADGESKILEDDIITIYGTCEGETSYISVLGSSITIPEVDVKYVKIK